MVAYHVALNGDFSHIAVILWHLCGSKPDKTPRPAVQKSAEVYSLVPSLPTLLALIASRLVYRMDVLDVYYVGGFGVMGWVAASDYSRAQPDPLVEHKSGIMQHMHADHKDALILLAKRFVGILRLKTQDGVKGTRIAFLREVSDPAETREVFVETVRHARQG
jgi:hypothetical protein